VNALIDRYLPRWLYLHEFALSLPSDDEADLKAAIALLVRDRLIVDGHLNEIEFRFLEGKPDLRTTAWVNKLSTEDFNWATSAMLAGVDTSKPGARVSDSVGILIEIAASALEHFEGKGNPPRRGVGGRKPIVDWKVVFVELKRLMDHYDEFGADVPEWNAQARLVEALQKFCSDKFGIEPDKNTIEGRIKEPLAQWREQRTHRPET
jgi:hypothetical protein